MAGTNAENENFHSSKGGNRNGGRMPVQWVLPRSKEEDNAMSSILACGRPLDDKGIDGGGSPTMELNNEAKISAEDAPPVTTESGLTLLRESSITETFSSSSIPAISLTRSTATSKPPKASISPF
eukprot:scaffold316_cov352-Pavlova_lutheri.AAC.46